MHLALTANGDFHPLTQGVHDGNTNAVQTTRNLVATSSKLAASVQHREHGFQGAFARAGMHIRRDAAAVITDKRGAVFSENNRDLVAMPSQGLIHGIVHHLVNEMVEATRPCCTDVHPRALPHRFESFKDLNLFGTVGGLNF